MQYRVAFVRQTVVCRHEDETLWSPRKRETPVMPSLRLLVSSELSTPACGLSEKCTACQWLVIVLFEYNSFQDLSKVDSVVLRSYKGALCIGES